MCDLLIDDDHRLGAMRVGEAEAASRHHGNAQGVEVMGSDGHVLLVAAGVGVSSLASEDFEGKIGRQLRGQAVDGSGRFDTGLRLQPCGELIHTLAERSTGGGLLFGEAGLEGEDVCRIEAG